MKFDSKFLDFASSLLGMNLWVACLCGMYAVNQISEVVLQRDINSYGPELSTYPFHSFC